MDALLAVETALEIVVPVVAGLVVLRFASPSSARRAARAAVGLFIVLVVMSALLSPGGDVLRPMIGGVVSAVVCVWVYLGLRRQHGLEPS